VIALCDFGGPFVAAAGRGNIVGMQFHPEKSQPAGMRILENFVAWDGGC
jgi:glutamine amidotransferase